MPTIYRKTDKGRTEIDTRAHRLTPRLRSALIMVDGQRSDDALRQLIAQQADETLAALLSQGFIEVAATLAAAPTAIQPSGPAAAPPPAVPVAGPPAGMSFEVWRREAVRSLNDTVGPAGETLAMKMEKAGDVATLRPLLDIARQVIQGARGSAAAAAFGARFID